MVLQYMHLKNAPLYASKEVILHSSIIVLNENPTGIKAGGEKGFALDFNRFKKSPLLVSGFAVFFALTSVL